MLNLIGLTITFFLAAVLLGKREKTSADYVLMIWLLVIGVHLALYYSVVSGRYLRFPYLLGAEIPFPLAYGPFLYLYTVELTRPGPKVWRRLVHFLPIVLAYLYVLPFYRLPVDRKIWVYQHQGEGFHNQQFVLLVAIILSGTLYALFSWNELRRHRKRIDYQFSNTENINLAWLRYLIAGISVIWLTIFLNGEEYIFGAVVVFVFFIGYFGIRQTGIFTDQPRLSLEWGSASPAVAYAPVNAPARPESGEVAIVEEEVAQQNAAGKYAKSGLNEGISRAIHQNLVSTMARERLFTNPELTLAELSEKLGTNANHLSQVINTIEEKNFYDYINALRIAEFIRISALPENQKYTLLHLALECGFNSKTSFNRNFKRHTGLSPSDFLSEKHIDLE